MKTKILEGKDSLLSILQMPAGIPVATVAIGKAGSINAALLAASILSIKYPNINKQVLEFRKKQTKRVLKASKLL
jgi:5-(carboxyamino)imidazole ribonucleotide mutase